MLKSTLSGIAENISNIVTKQKMFVIMDGIEKVDKSVVEYY